MKKTKIVKLKGIADHPLLYSLDDDGKLSLLTEKQLRQHIHHFPDLSAKAKEKYLKRWLKKDDKVIQTLKVNTYLSNSPWKLDGSKPTCADRKQGAQALLAVSDLFDCPAPGYRLLADALCGLHATALREAAPTFQPTISIRSNSPEIEHALRSWVKAVVPRKKWEHKRWTVKRKAILDYQKQGSFSPQVQDHSRLRIKSKYGKIKRPFPYRDTLALVVDADKSQTKKLSPFIKDAAAILLNSSATGLNPTAISASEIASYNPSALQMIENESPRTASLLRYWWGYCDDEDLWAAQIVQAARASFGEPDGKYVASEPEPKRFRDAIRYHVLLNFLDMLEDEELMTPDELCPYRQGVKDVFDPAPPEPDITGPAESPDVFKALMREIATTKSDCFAAENVSFTEADNHLAAWRVISGQKYLVFPEDIWAATYAKAAKTHKGINTAFFKRTHWEREMQGALCEKKLIKKASSGHRYRYNIYHTGKPEYVVAIPADLLVT